MMTVSAWTVLFVSDPSETGVDCVVCLLCCLSRPFGNLKTVSKQELFASVRKVAAGERVIGADIAVDETSPSVNLSPRQREVLESVTRGLSNADIAQQLGISPSAVKLYLSAVFEKLGAASRAEAVAIALKRQLLKL